jgi:hypothetical protein
MAETAKARTLVHWALWRDDEEQEYIRIGRTRFDASGRGQTKFQATPTSAWQWRCVTLPEGECPPELPPLPLHPRQTQQQQPAEAKSQEPARKSEPLPGEEDEEPQGLFTSGEGSA